MSPRDKDRRKLTGRNVGLASAGAGLLIVSIAALIATIGGNSDTPSSGATILRLDLLAARDVGALPARDSWCSGADHCWIFQQSSGDATDYGDTGGWHLTPNNSPRAGIVSSIPVRDASGWVDYTSELATWMNGSQWYSETPATHSATAVFSVTALVNFTKPPSGVQYLIYQDNVTGWSLYQTATNWAMLARGTTTVKIAQAPATNQGSWQCVTAVYDTRTSNAAKFYQDGAEVTMVISDLSGVGNISVSYLFRLGVSSGGLVSGVSRLRIDYDVATSLEQHQALCGDLWQAPAGGRSDNKPLAADDTWTQTAGSGCYPTGSTSAVCVPGGLMPYTVDATGMGWPVQQALANRVLYSTAIDCTNWTCSGTATATYGAIAPDGSATASTVSVAAGANHVEQDPIAGYTANAPLHLALWVKCAGTGNGRLRASHTGTPAGDWTVNCTCLHAGDWHYIDDLHPCVTVNTPWQADGSGNSGLHFDGVIQPITGDIWAPTITEQHQWSRVVIPTGASAVSLGSPIWAIANSTGAYYRAGDTVLQSLSEYSGTCFAVPGSDILLSGSPTCSGTWYGLQVKK